MAGCDEAKSLASMEEEACIEKKYGGIAPKKPLISKDHERAYFDSADWVLGKVNDKSSVQYSGMHVIRLNLTLYPGVPSASCKQQRFKGRG
jgi:hypothetical protein